MSAALNLAAWIWSAVLTLIGVVAIVVLVFAVVIAIQSGIRKTKEGRKNDWDD